MLRPTGKTTQQLKGAPRDAVFVWVNSALHYPVKLARSLKREDILVVAPWEITQGVRFFGMPPRPFVVDHACELTTVQKQTLEYLTKRWGP